MDVVFGADIYSLQSKGGISRIFNELIPRLATYEDIKITILTRRKLLQDLPYCNNASYLNFSPLATVLRPRRYWGKLINLASNLTLKYGVSKIWHSTYYSSLNSWKGLKIVSVYDLIHEQFPELFPNKYEEALRKQKKMEILSADKIISISNTTTSFLQEIYPTTKGKIVTIPLAHNNRVFKPISPEKCGEYNKIFEPYILYVGLRSFHKNFAELVKAYSFWSKRNEVRLILVGPELDPSEVAFLNEMKILNRVKVFSTVDDETLSGLYNQACAYVNTSLFEGFGIPILEALACECPIFASPIPTTIEIAGSVPFYFDINKTDSIIKALDDALIKGKEPKRVQEGIACANLYSWDNNAKETYLTYKSVKQ